MPISQEVPLALVYKQDVEAPYCMIDTCLFECYEPNVYVFPKVYIC